MHHPDQLDDTGLIPARSIMVHSKVYYMERYMRGAVYMIRSGHHRLSEGALEHGDCGQVLIEYITAELSSLFFSVDF